MNDALRSLRLGAVSLFGVAVPGFVLILLATVGLLVPSLAIAFHVSEVSLGAISYFIHTDRWILVGVILILSYVAGFILRLTSPDELDKISTKHVLASLTKEEKSVWPCKGEDGDQFPYFHFSTYLKARGHDDLLSLVEWGPDADSKTTKRSKTAVHKMKLDIFLSCPQLSDMIDSNEAHIRLMAGTWLAIRTTTGFLIAGIVVALAGLSLTHAALLSSISEAIRLSSMDVPPYAAILVINAFLLASGHWANKRIESLFHYRRINELVFIVMATQKARSIQQQIPKRDIMREAQQSKPT